jgi:3-carboxy-cis,cis-muconate cycloisomerase
MPPSSSTSDASPPGLFDGVLARGRVREDVSDRAWVQAMLDVEAALAAAEARAGLISAEDAEAIRSGCRAERFDVPALGAAAAAGGNPVIPLVRALTDAVGEPAGHHVHKGATSQDVLDSAAMLVAHRALGSLLDDLGAAAASAARLAETHRHTLVAGRTLLQQALPVTFGFKAAGWLVALDEVRDRLADVRRRRLAVQLGGAVGTLASLGEAGPQVVSYLADELGLSEPAFPWHTIRTRPAELAGALGEAAGVIAKVAADVVLLAQTEVGEVAEDRAGGGSSTLPHKRNPIAAVSASACAAQAPGHVATVLAAMAHEHERAAGSWHAEWGPSRELLRSTGAAAAWLRECLDSLRVDERRMRDNLGLTGGLLLAERVTSELAGHLGRLPAHDLVTDACRRASRTGRPLADELGEVPEVAALVDPARLRELLDPAGWVGSAATFVDRALDRHRARKEEDV